MILAYTGLTGSAVAGNMGKIITSFALLTMTDLPQPVFVEQGSGRR